MWRFYLVDFIVFLAATSAFLLMPLRNEFIYQRVAEKHHYNESKNDSYCLSNGTNQTNEDQVLADEVSRWTMYINLSIFVPAMLAGAILTSWGDKVGRKITLAIPLLGMALSSVIQALIIHLHWPLATMFAYGVVAGGTGYFMTVLIQGTTYLSDVTPLRERGKRFTILETFIGIGGGVAGVGGGYWIKAQGFIPSVWFSAFLPFVGLCLVPLLPDSLTYKLNQQRLSDDEDNNHSCQDSSTNSDDDADDPPLYIDISGEKNNTESTSLLPKSKGGKEKGKYTFSDLWKAVWKVYTTEYMTCEKCFGPNPDLKVIGKKICEHGGGLKRGRIWRLWLYIISYCSYMFINVGILVFQTIFFLAYPLCFTAVLVGAQLSVKFVSTAAGPFLVHIFQRCCGMGNQSIIMISLFGFFAFPFLMCFAHQAWLVFVATSTLMIGSIAKPFMQAQVSSLASESEQGAAFALLSSSEVLSFLLATVSYLSMYAAAQHISHWFTWMFSAAVAVIPIVLMGIVWVADRRVYKIEINEEKEKLYTEA